VPLQRVPGEVGIAQSLAHRHIVIGGKRASLALLSQADARIRTGDPFITSWDSGDSVGFGEIRFAPATPRFRSEGFETVRRGSGRALTPPLTPNPGTSN
jgi:hypothetical protein